MLRREKWLNGVLVTGSGIASSEYLMFLDLISPVYKTHKLYLYIYHLMYDMFL